MRAGVICVFVAFGVGCARGGAEEPAPIAASPGGEAPVSALPPDAIAPIPEEATEPPPAEPSGPGRLLVVVRLGADAHPGAVHVLDADGAVVAEAHDGDELELPAGRYSLAGAVDDSALLVDTPERTSEPVELPPEGEATLRLVFGRARVRVMVTSGGQPLPSAVVELHRTRTSELVVEHPADGRFVPISPGRYDLYVTDRGHTVRATDIPFQNGASQTIPVRFE